MRGVRGPFVLPLQEFCKPEAAVKLVYFKNPDRGRAEKIVRLPGSHIT